ARGYVLRDRAARADVGPFPHRHRRHQGGVAPDEGPGLDPRGVLGRPVVVAGDGPGPDVDGGTHRRVADVGEVRHLGALAQPGLLELDEVADLGPGADVALGPDVGEGAHGRPRFDHAGPQQAVVEDLRAG